MTERYLFFNSTLTDRRKTKASDMAEYWKAFLTDGFVRLGGSIELNVSADGTSQQVKVSKGSALLKGYLYINDAPLTLPVKGSSPVEDRYDRVILRLDLNVENRYIKAFVVEGNAGGPPDLVRNELVYEISIAQIHVKAGKSYIEQSDLIDERLDPVVGGVSMVKSANNAMDMLIGDDSKNYDSNNVEDALDELRSPLNVYRSQFDEANGVYRLVEWKRRDGTLYRSTTLSSIVGSNYTVQTIKKYGTDGSTVLKTEVFDLSYNANGDLQNEVKR